MKSNQISINGCMGPLLKHPKIRRKEQLMKNARIAAFAMTCMNCETYYKGVDEIWWIQCDNIHCNCNTCMVAIVSVQS